MNARLMIGRRFVQVALSGALLLGAWLGVTEPKVAHAGSCDRANAAAVCKLDQAWWGNAGGDGFGLGTVLGQTFVPRVRTRVCAVRLKLQRNTTLSLAGTVKLSVVTNNPNVVIQSAAIAAAAIPMGVVSEQTFVFGCVGPILPVAPYYGLKLSSPGSAANAYTWINSDALGDGAYPFGHGWFNPAGGAGAWVQRPYDYAFQIYTCQ